MAVPTVPSGVELLRSDVRRRLLDHLAELPVEGPPGSPTRDRGLTAAELADLIDLHVTTVRFHVDQLVRAGLLVAHNDRPTRAGRPRKLYALPSIALEPPEDPEAHRAYVRLTRLLGPTLEAADEGAPPRPEEAGYRWAVDHVAPGTTEDEREPARTQGAWLAKVGRVVDVLGEWGYFPEVRTRDRGRTAELLLPRCPFVALANIHPEVACGVHRGLLRGTLDALGEDAAVSLQPFVGPDTCLAHLSTRTPFTEPGGTT